MGEASISGLHHITAVAGDPQRNVDFYTLVLGLRLIKVTVNFEEPSTYHLYYGNETGSPGSILSFFTSPFLPQGRRGASQITTVALCVPLGAIRFWRERLASKNVRVGHQEKRFEQDVLTFYDPDGLQLEFIEDERCDHSLSNPSKVISAETAVCGLHSVTLSLHEQEATAITLTDVLGFSYAEWEGARHRYTLPNKGPGCFIDLIAHPTDCVGHNGKGIIHHAAFSTESQNDLTTWESTLVDYGIEKSSITDEKYYKSINFHEPSGVELEIATKYPGFMVDEDLLNLGTQLQLPSSLEAQRNKILGDLIPIHAKTELKV